MVTSGSKEDNPFQKTNKTQDLVVEEYHLNQKNRVQSAKVANFKFDKKIIETARQLALQEFDPVKLNIKILPSATKEQILALNLSNTIKNINSDIAPPQTTSRKDLDTFRNSSVPAAAQTHRALNVDEVKSAINQVAATIKTMPDNFSAAAASPRSPISTNFKRHLLSSAKNRSRNKRDV